MTYKRDLTQACLNSDFKEYNLFCRPKVSFFPLIKEIPQFVIKGISSNLRELYFHILLLVDQKRAHTTYSIFIWLWPTNGRKHEYLGLIRLDYYSPYFSIIQVLDSTPSWILGNYSAYYSTPNNGRISNIFRIARRGRVIRRSLVA